MSTKPRAYAILSARLAEEQRDHPIPITVDDIPLGFEKMTPEWLTLVLCKDIPGAAITDFQLGNPDEGTSSRRRVTFTYNNVGQQAGLPSTVFAKSTHTLSSRLRLAFVGFITAEVNFYWHMRQLLDFEAPQCWFANINDHTFNSIIFLRDMTETATFCRHDHPMTRARVENQLRTLATLHAKFYAKPNLAEQFSFLRTWDDLFSYSAEAGYRRACVRGFQMSEQVIPSKVFAQEADIWPATMASALRHAKLPQMVIHSDVHLKNWYITNEGEMGLSDWQCVCRGHWSRDLAYCISTALTTEQRRNWEQDLIKYYLEHLHAAGAPTFSFDFAWRHYREQLFGALAWWTGTLGQPAGTPDMQPPASSLEFIGRISRAIDDLVPKVEAFV